MSQGQPCLNIVCGSLPGGSRCLRSRRFATLSAPKSFAGLFGAAPSIALAILLITLSQKGAPFVTVEGRSMIVGAFARALYSWTVCVFLKKFLLSSWTATMAAHCLVRCCAWCIRPLSTLMIVQFKPLRPSSDALVRVSRPIRARRGDDRSRRPYRGPLRASHWRSVSRLSRDFSRKRDIDRKACPGTQGKSGSVGSPARQGSRGADAVGAALGSFGLAAFGLVIWLMIVQSPASALVLAAASWLGVAPLTWQVRRWL